MRRGLITVALAFAVTFGVAGPAGAITGGQLDGNRHPYGALLLVPGLTFCSGTLIDEDVVLTAGHCTDFWSDTTDEFDIREVWVTFDSVASVDPDTWLPTGGTWYRTNRWSTHPGYNGANWPFTADYGIVQLRKEVAGITPAALPQLGLVDALIGTSGQTEVRFTDVGYGQDGVTLADHPYTRNFDFVRKYSTQRYNPSDGTVGTLDPLWLILGNTSSDNGGAGCGGDSGSGIYPTATGLTDTVVAVHTGGYRLGYLNRLCGKITSLNHRIDVPVVLSWIQRFLD